MTLLRTGEPFSRSLQDVEDAVHRAGWPSWARRVVDGG